MTKRIIGIALSLVFSGSMFAQKGKVQAAWRGLSDYEETLKDGKPDVSYLDKANEAINLALANEDTKKQAKTHAYKLRISYAKFQYNVNEEKKKLEASIGDKNERTLAAYGNISLADFETAAEELNQVKDLDPKFLATIQEGLEKGVSSLDEDELKFAMAVQSMRIESGNIASGKYRAKKYGEAADYFYKTGIMNTILYKTKDTSNFYNACISAAKAKDNEKMLEYNKKMIEAKISSPYNYEACFQVLMEKKDTANAMEFLRKGRVLFPEDMSLLTQETNLFLEQGKQVEALNNLKVSVEKDPKNPIYYFFIGQIFESMANPKDKTTRKDLEKPKNFDDLFKNAEANYLKSIELKPTNKEYLYNSLYNLGAMYNNYGGYLSTYKIEKITDAARLQKENDAKAQEYYRKAIPYLEQALSIRSDDKSTMGALRKLYMLTGNEAKAKEMSERMR